MKPSKFQVLFSFLMFGLVAGLIGQAVDAIVGLPAEVTVIALTAFMLMRSVRKVITGQSLYSVSGIVKFDVEVEMWSNWIAENIYKNNEFLNHCVIADEYVLQGKVVHIPQAGAASNAVKNRNSLPASVTKRTDTDVTYPLDEYTTDPRLVSKAEQLQLSYDKIASVMEDDIKALRQLVAENVLLNWAPSGAANIVRTTGGGGATPVEVEAYLPSQTNNRLSCHHDDILAIMNLMNENDDSEEDRYGLLSARMYGQLIKSLSKTEYVDFSRAYDPAKGIMGELHGIKLMKRSSVLIYDNAAPPVVKAYGAAGAATDNDASLFWTKQAVERAMGSVETFYNAKESTFYGDVMSHIMFMGGRKRRNDQKGVYALVQDVVPA